MKRVEAVVRTSKLDEIVNRLHLIGTNGLTVTEVHGMSASTTTVTVVHGHRMQQFAAPRYQIMTVVRDEDAAHVVAAILRTAHTGSPGDGIITVADVLGVMRIRTNEVDDDAV
ncbi:MAG TPA: P-II family nitrogen regulator [Polyangia bacterium]|nr:P-II family nitrogen regulator [Polyangia bacterium]